MKKINLIGMEFGMLTVIAEAESRKGKARWLCRCVCGNTVTVNAYDLRSGNTKTCGCSRKEANAKSGMARRGVPSGRLLDLTGLRFGRLVVISHAGKSEKGVHLWHCQCDCGNVVVIRGDVLRYGQTKSCGCLAKEIHAERCRSRKGMPSPKLIDLTGKRFGRLTVLRRATKDDCQIDQQVKWVCRCDCGKITYPTSAVLRSGHTSSCGCRGLERATEAKMIHGDTCKESPYHYLLGVFHAMHNRCEDPKVNAYPWYGGKGIKVCPEWSGEDGYMRFKSWSIANGYAKGLSIDRIDPMDDYRPGNCRWITLEENRSRARRKAQREEK